MIKITKEQFASDERAKNIRTVCIEIADLMHNADTSTEYAIEREIARLNPLIAKLQGEMGIVAHMHTGMEPEFFDSPCLVAEFVAGQAVGIIKNKSYYAFNMLEHTLYMSFDAED